MNITVLDPVAQPKGGTTVATPKMSSLQNKRVAILNNKWQSMDVISEQLSVYFREEHGVKQVDDIAIPIAKAADPELLDEIAKSVTFAVVGLAN